MFSGLALVRYREQLPSRGNPRRRRDVLQTYTVIGIGLTGSRLAEAVEAHSAADAELATNHNFEYVASVLEGAVVVDPNDVYTEDREWSVFAFYADNDQRYGPTVFARSADQATVAAYEQMRPEDPEDEELEICVCGVALGQQMSADVYAGDEGWARAEYAFEELQEEAEREAGEVATRKLPEIGVRSRQSGLAERVCLV